MPVTIKPENLKRVTRLSAQIKEIIKAKSKSSPWNSSHRLVACDNTLRFLTTDGSTFLKWNIQTEEEFQDEFDIVVDAEQFNAVAARLLEGESLKLSSCGDLLSIIQGRRDLKFKVRPTSNYPNSGADPDAIPDQSMSWNYNSKSLARSLEFVIPFIDFNHPNPAKSVATLQVDGHLIGGSPSRVAQVHGLEPIHSPLSFKQHTAKRVAAFLNEIKKDVRVTIAAGTYLFSCPEQGHELIVEGSEKSFLLNLENLDKMDHERLKLDRKLLDNSLAFLSTVVAEEGKPLSLRFQGQDEQSSVRLSTLDKEESTRSTDEIPIIRSFCRPATLLHQGEQPSQVPAVDSHVKIRSETLRGVLAKLETNFIDMKFYPARKLLLVKEESAAQTDPVRSVLMTVAKVGAQSGAQVAGPTAEDLTSYSTYSGESVEPQETSHGVRVEEQAVETVTIPTDQGISVDVPEESHRNEP